MPIYDEKIYPLYEMIDRSLTDFLPVYDSTVSAAMRYACLDGGKRLRPVLLLAFVQLCGGEIEKAVPFAAALEMIHAYSLIHDDMPCMDDSPMRRGKPSVHAAYGEDMALLTGDALLNRAYEVILNPRLLADYSGESMIRAGSILARAAGLGQGDYPGMIGGQELDIQSEDKLINLDTLERLQQGKTAALIRAACQTGAVLGGGNEAQIAAAGQFGLSIGLCFQIVDDILDVTSSAEQMGKPVGSDGDHHKNTYPGFLGLEKAKELARQRTKTALDALSVFGEEAESLRFLAEELLIRKF
ncbi:MAG: polyprenyl synthetase family protein [Oscillospiraceae bacterium]|nr:polyprenyl synthetase family protein [Oscillospiraceae bacterium]